MEIPSPPKKAAPELGRVFGPFPWHRFTAPTLARVGWSPIDLKLRKVQEVEGYSDDEDSILIELNEKPRNDRFTRCR